MKTELDFQAVVSNMVCSDMFLRNWTDVDTPLILCGPVDRRPSSAGLLIAPASEITDRSKEDIAILDMGFVGQLIETNKFLGLLILKLLILLK